MLVRQIAHSTSFSALKQYRVSFAIALKIFEIVLKNASGAR
jgi:hypothetical protein